MIDRELVTRKLTLILPDLKECERLARFPLQEFMADSTHQALAERFLERMIGRMIDVNFHLITETGGAPPRDYYESFVALGSMGILPAEFARTIARAAGLRNRIAHEYDEVDPSRLHEGLLASVGDVPAYLGHIERFLEKHPDR